MPHAKREQQLANDDLTGLAKAWESDPDIRASALEHGCLLAWADPKQIGLVNLRTLKLNSAVIKILLTIYLPQVPQNKSCYVDPLKLEAGSCLTGSGDLILVLLQNCVIALPFFEVSRFRDKLHLGDNASMVHCEGTALKSFVSLVNRRNDGCERRES